MADLTEAQLAKIAELRTELGDDVDALLKKGGEEGLTQLTLRRWLAARSWDVKKAHKDLAAHATWRAEYVPNGRISESEIEPEIAQNKAFLQGFDNYGHPLCIVVVSRHKPDDHEICKRSIAYCLDCSTMMLSKHPNLDGKMVGIFDLRGMTIANYDVSALRAVFDLLQHHYPERLAKMYLYCAPMIFYALWKVVSPFVDPVTKEKVVFVYEKEAAESFAKDFDPKILPPEFSGTSRWITVKEMYNEMLTNGKIATA